MITVARMQEITEAVLLGLPIDLDDEERDFANRVELEAQEISEQNQVVDIPKEWGVDDEEEDS